MLTKMSYGEVPGYLRRSNPNKSFAAKTIEEFLELNCDAAEVTGWPLKSQTVQTKAAHLKAAVKERNCGRTVSVSSSGDSVYLIRVR